MKIDIGTRNFEADGKIRDYVKGKVGALEKYLPRKARPVAMAQVMLEEDPSGREHNRYVAEVKIVVPGTVLVSSEGAISMFAAVDIVEAKLKAQVRTYKDKQRTGGHRARLLSRWFGRTAPDASASEPQV
ncbi:MAG TPA: ribosome-associated translation inhibitor RaiA [Candidatus Saccharimonas sp.]|nr:ribosome-associated translation inhibitor RaiA [Candidatus Saccharimonas sp.]